MSRELKITAGEIEATACLNDTETASKISGILPISSEVNVWGDEIYFAIPVETGLEDAHDTVALGDIAYWPEGNALCIFFGKTPVSEGNEIRPISPVNIVGRIEVDRDLFQRLLTEFRRGTCITLC